MRTRAHVRARSSACSRSAGGSGSVGGVAVCRVPGMVLGGGVTEHLKKFPLTDLGGGLGGMGTQPTFHLIVVVVRHPRE